MKQTQLVVAYVRVSTEEQERNGYGIRVQLRDVRAFAKKMNVTVDRLYADKAESGALENRTELQKLLDQCELGRIATVIIPTIDRLSRDVRIAENLFWTFSQKGVRVLIVDMPHYDPDNRKDVLLRQIREAIAEENRKEIIERLWKARCERVRNGHPAGGEVPYGYRRRRKKFVEYPKESAIVRRILEMVDGKLSTAEIVAGLNLRGHRRRNGTGWTRRQVLAITNRRALYERGVIRYGEIAARNEQLVLVR